MKDLSKVGQLNGHTQRVLYMALNPSGSILVTGAGDETLRFWNLGYQEREQSTRENQRPSFMGQISLR